MRYSYDPKALAFEASTRALKLRQAAGVKLNESLCVYDLVQDYMGIEVHFEAIASLEGVYRKSPQPLIVITSLRPAARQAYTCAHELGHHVYGHGSHIDDQINEKRSSGAQDPNEFIADSFAGFLLMPKTTVNGAFVKRGWKAECPTPEQIYTIASWLGVGYTTLTWHMCLSLRLISVALATNLVKKPLPRIRSQIMGEDVNDNLVVVDRFWAGRPIDLQVGDLVLLPSGVLCEGSSVQFLNDGPRGSLYQATAPGTGRFYDPQTDWASYTRVSRREYAGRGIYRHLEDEDNDE